MAQQIIPLDNAPNQVWQVAVSINGGVSQFFVTLRYNEVGGYWVGTFDDSNRNLILDSLPLLTGTNLLGQLQYLNIGSLYILPASGTTAPDYPNSQDLGSDFVMVWSDNVTVAQVA